MNVLLKFSAHLVRILLALLFAVTGLEKLVGAEVSHFPFSILGMPEWFGYFIGGCELLGAVGLLLPQTRKLAAVGLAVIMLGAIYYHLSYAIGSVIPAAILLLLLITTIVLSSSKKTVAAVAQAL